MVSNDNGGSWSAQQVGQFSSSAISANNGGSFSIAASPTDPAKVWLTTKASNFSGCVWFTSCSTLWRSTDGGRTWTEALNMRFAYTRTTHPLIPAEGNADNSIGFRFREPVGVNDPTFEASSDGLANQDFGLNPLVQVGSSWANYARKPNAFFADPSNGKRLVVMANTVFLFSNDGGHSWILRTSPSGMNNGNVIERGPAAWKIAAASTYSYVWNPSLYTAIAYTRDLGKTWVKKDGNLKTQTTALTMVISSLRLRP